MFGRYMLTTVKLDAAAAAAAGQHPGLEPGRPRQQGAFADASATRWCSATRRSTRSASRTTTPTFTARTSRLGFAAPDVGIKIYSYLEDYMLLTVTTAASRSAAAPKARRASRRRRTSVSDDLTIVRGAPPVRRRRQRRVLDVAVAGERAVAGPVHLRRRDHRASALADFLVGQVAVTFIQAAPNTLDMQQWYFGLYAQDTWKLSPKATLNYGAAMGAGLRAADPQRRDLQLQRRSLPRQHKTTQFTQRAAGIPVSRRPGLRQRQGGDGEPLEAVLAARRLRVGSDGRRHERRSAPAIRWPTTSSTRSSTSTRRWRRRGAPRCA